jgi:type IV fimbrial biogenesis protein FimT
MSITPALTRPNRLRGFTLIELMVTIAVLAILLAVAVPSFQRASMNARLSAQTNELIASLKEARSEAARRGVFVAVRANSEEKGFNDGWKVFVGDGKTEADESTVVVRVVEALPASITLTRTDADFADSSAEDKDYVTFGPRGQATVGYFRVCSSMPDMAGRGITLTTTGKVSVVASGISCSTSP